MMPAIQYKTNDLYQLVREAFNQGYTLKEIAQMSGCKYDIVCKWTKDLRYVRNIKPYQRYTAEEKDTLAGMMAKGMNNRKIADKTGMEMKRLENFRIWNKELIQKKREELKAKKGEENMAGGFISQQIDITMLNAENAIRREQEPKPANLEPKPEKKLRLKQTNVRLEGAFVGYDVTPGEHVRLSMYENTITMDGISIMIEELQEILNTYGGKA